MRDETNIHPVDRWGEYFDKIEPLLNKFGTVTYSLRIESYIVIANKEVTDLVADMNLNFTGKNKNIEAIKKWNNLLESLEELSINYVCFIKITDPRCLESYIVDAKMGEIDSSIFGKYNL